MEPWKYRKLLHQGKNEKNGIAEAIPFLSCPTMFSYREAPFAQPPSYAGLAAAAVIAATAIVAAAAIVVAAATAAAAAGEDQDDEDQDPQAAAAAKTTVIIAHKTNPL